MIKLDPYTEPTETPTVEDTTTMEVSQTPYSNWLASRREVTRAEYADSIGMEESDFMEVDRFFLFQDNFSYTKTGPVYSAQYCKTSVDSVSRHEVDAGLFYISTVMLHGDDWSEGVALWIETIVDQAVQTTHGYGKAYELNRALSFLHDQAMADSLHITIEMATEEGTPQPTEQQMQDLLPVLEWSIRHALSGKELY